MEECRPFTLLNTRPSHQANALTQKVQAQGGQVLACPTLQIEWQPASLEALQALMQAPIWIVTSPNALSGLQQWLSELPEIAQHAGSSVQMIFPIGQATQRELHHWLTHLNLPNERLQQSLKNARIPSPAHPSQNSEALLEQISTLNLNAASVALIKGVGGRGLLADQLQAKRFHVEPIETYRRVPAPFCQQAWRQFRRAERPVLLASSVESWHNLKEAVIQQEGEADWQWVQQQPCIVFSQRIAQALTKGGWQGPLWVTSPGDQNIVEMLQVHQ